MLFIGDIHINPVYKDRLLQQIRSVISQFPEEKTIVFAGDYVYHFSYDRASLLALYDLFLELFFAGKSVYVLAWNHDRLGNTFVFQEAKKAFDVITSLDKEQTLWNVHFITEPLLATIEGDTVLFLPYMLSMPSTATSIDDPSLAAIVDWLDESKNKHEQLSWSLNRLLYSYVKEQSSLTVIHHYYTQWVHFPWQQSVFWYRDLAISPWFLEQPSLRFLSWHLHQAFTYKNYFCVGSLWNTTPLEINQVKGVARCTHSQITFIPLYVNPYLFLDSSKEKEYTYPLDSKQLPSYFTQIYQGQLALFSDTSVWKTGVRDVFSLDMKDVSLSLKVDTVDYEHIEQYLDKDVYHSIKDCKLKKVALAMDQLLDDLDLAHKDLTHNFADWKTLLKIYIQKKYGDEYDKYEQWLKKLQLL